MFIDSKNTVLLDGNRILNGNYTRQALITKIAETLWMGCGYSDSKDAVDQLSKAVEESYDALVVLAGTKTLKVDTSEVLKNKALDKQSIAIKLAKISSAEKAIILKQVKVLSKIGLDLEDPTELTIILMQKVPEIYEALTCHHIFTLRSDLQNGLAQCVQDALSNKTEQVKLTDVSTSVSVGIFFTKTLLKTVTNVFTLSLGGALLDVIHDSLETHGASNFDFNREMIAVKDTNTKTGEAQKQGNVSIRTQFNTDRLTNMSAKQAGTQLASDTADNIVNSGLDSGLGTIKDELSSWFFRAFQAVSNLINGKDIDEVNCKKALTAMLLPIEVLLRRIQAIDDLIWHIILDAIDDSGITANPNDLSNLSKLESVSAIVSARLGELKIHSYLTYITYLSNQYVKVHSPKEIYKVLMAQTLTENGKYVVQHSQVLSSPLWGLMNSKGLAEQGDSTGKIEGPKDFLGAVAAFLDQPCPADTKTTIDPTKKWSSKYKTCATSDTAKLYCLFLRAKQKDLLSVTSGSQFGTASTLSTLARCSQFVDNFYDRNIDTVNKLIELSSYRKFTSKVGVSFQDKPWWKGKLENEFNEEMTDIENEIAAAPRSQERPEAKILQ